MRISRKLSDESGQAVVIAALCMVVIIAFLGLAIDVGHLRQAKRNLQIAADAAALAAALEVRICGDLISGATPNCPAMQAAANNALIENGYTSPTVVTTCSPATGTGVTLIISNPPSCLGSDPNAKRNNYVEAIVSEKVQTYFARIVGLKDVSISARAEAARGIGGPCIYALDPSGPNAISVLIALGIVAQCAIIDESTNSAALTCVVGLLISAPKISVAGETQGFLCASTPPATPHVPAPNPPDPLGYLPAPTPDNCPTSSSGPPYFGSSQPINLVVPLLANIEFNPGVYCGGISITASLLSQITFKPGIYILKDGHGSFLGIPGPTTSGLTLTVGLLSSITGSGVMFYNEGSHGSFSLTEVVPLLGLSKFNLSAPTSGEYAGILFFQAHDITNTGTFLLNLLGSSNLEGAIYMPDAHVTYGVGIISSTYTILVAKDIQFNLEILNSFGSNYASLWSGSPLNGDSATLVQ